MRVSEDSTSGSCKFRIKTFIVKINVRRYLSQTYLSGYKFHILQNINLSLSVPL